MTCRSSLLRSRQPSLVLAERQPVWPNEIRSYINPSKVKGPAPPVKAAMSSALGALVGGEGGGAGGGRASSGSDVVRDLQVLGACSARWLEQASAPAPSDRLHMTRLTTGPGISGSGETRYGRGGAGVATGCCDAGGKVLSPPPASCTHLPRCPTRPRVWRPRVGRVRCCLSV